MSRTNYPKVDHTEGSALLHTRNAKPNCKTIGLITLVVILIGALVATCVIFIKPGQPQGSTHTDIPCTNLIPGLDRLAQGIDLTKLDIFHDQTTSSDDGFAYPILTYHCNQNRTWKSPFDSTTYQVPDEIDSVTSLPSGLMISDVRTENNIHEVKKTMAEEVGIDLTFSKGSFSASQSYQEAHNTLVNTSSYLAQAKAFVSVNELNLIPPTSLNSSLNQNVRRFIDELPTKYENSPVKYMEFFRTYGTHYFERAKFGGTLTTWLRIDSYLKTTMDDRRISVNAQATFLGILKVHGAYNSTVNTVDSEFESHTQHGERYFGGTANLFDSKGYTAWWPTVGRSPWLYAGNLQPITNLIIGPKKDELVKASQVYFDRNYLQELRRDLYSVVRYNGLARDTALDFINKIDAVANVYDYSTLRNLSEKITFFTDDALIPYWFRQTSLCAHGLEGRQEPECATMCEETRPFPPCQYWPHDGHDYYCALGLEFVSPSAPDWFNQVSLEAAGGRCDDGDWYVCAKFMLRVPFSAPSWLREMQLCFFNDYGGISKSCVGLNTWTDEYRFNFKLGNKAHFKITPRSIA